MRALRNLFLLGAGALAVSGCATNNQAANQPPDDAPAVHTVYVPHPGSNHVGGEEPMDDTPQ